MRATGLTRDEVVDDFFEVLEREATAEAKESTVERVPDVSLAGVLSDR